MFPVTSTKHVHLTSNLYNIELQFTDEDGKKSSYESSSETNKKDKTTDFSVLSNEIDRDVNLNKDCKQGNNIEDNHHLIFYKDVNNLDSSDYHIDKNTDVELPESVNYNPTENQPPRHDDVIKDSLSDKQKLSEEENLTASDPKNKLENIILEKNFNRCEQERKDDVEINDDTAKKEDVYEDEDDDDVVFDDNLSTSVVTEQVVPLHLQHSMTDMNNLAKNQSLEDNNYTKLTAAILKKQVNSNDNDLLTVPTGSHNITSDFKQNKSAINGNFLKRDVIRRFGPSCPAIPRSLSEDIPVIVRRRGCTLRVRIASITEGDLERLREVCSLYTSSL